MTISPRHSIMRSAEMFDAVLAGAPGTSPVAVIVLTHLLCGLTSAIHNEVPGNFFLIVLGVLPLVCWISRLGGWSGLTAKLATVGHDAGSSPRLVAFLEYMDSPIHHPGGGMGFGCDGIGFAPRVLGRLLGARDFLVVSARWPRAR